MISKENLFELWEKGGRVSNPSRWVLLQNGIVGFIDDEAFLKEVKDYRSRDRKNRASWRGRTTRRPRYPMDYKAAKLEEESIGTMGNRLAKQLEEMMVPHTAKWNADHRALVEEQRAADAPNKHIGYAIMVGNKFYNGLNGGDRPNIYWNKEKAIKRAKALRNPGARKDVKLIEMEISATNNKLNLE